MTTAAILQPSYIPWRGYFHQIQKVDFFIFYDDVQYDKHGWRNRNRIKTAQGSHWLTIPVHSKGNVTSGLPINQVHIDWATPWNLKHWQTIHQTYRNAPFFKECIGLLEPFYANRPELLGDYLMAFTEAVAKSLGIAHTKFLRSSSMAISGDRTERLVRIVESVGATHYLSGPSAQNYLDEKLLSDHGISLEYMTYDYAEYPQLYPPYDPHVSIIDLMMMTGPNASSYIWGDSL